LPAADAQQFAGIAVGAYVFDAIVSDLRPVKKYSSGRRSTFPRLWFSLFHFHHSSFLVPAAAGKVGVRPAGCRCFCALVTTADRATTWTANMRKLPDAPGDSPGQHEY
jgi:hypothetical protein